MTAKELINVIEDDLKTATDQEELRPYADLIRFVAEQYPDSEIDTSATAHGLKNAMFQHAKKNKKDNVYVFVHDESIRFCKEYLKIQEHNPAKLHSNARKVNLEDFF